MINTVTNNFEIKLPPTGLTYEHYPLMKERYQDYFSFWVFDRGEIDDLIYNYESYTPGNEMKLESTQNAKGTFTYQAANKMMQTYADRNHNLKFYGHTLTSHSQSPPWMRDAPPCDYDRETALENMETHIENVLSYYSADFVATDVVNEAIGVVILNDWKGSVAKWEG